MMHALRSWLRTPRLALTLLACIAISIGGTATVFTFVHAILLRPLPYPHAERLVTIVPTDLGETRLTDSRLSVVSELCRSPRGGDFLRAAGRRDCFPAHRANDATARNGCAARRSRRASSTCLGCVRNLGARSRPMNMRAPSERAIILSSRIWRTRFGADPRRARPGDFRRVSVRRSWSELCRRIISAWARSDGADYWLAEKQNNHPDMLTDRATITTLALGRLKPGVTRATGRERSEFDPARPGCGPSRRECKTRGESCAVRASAGASRCAAGCSRCWSAPAFSC